MGGYVANFAVYTMAMTGLIFFALMVYKKCMFPGGIKSSKTKMLNIEETISIAPRKTLYVIKAGSERFLIAGDIDKTTLISRLDNIEVNNPIDSTHCTDDYTAAAELSEEIPTQDIIQVSKREKDVREELEKLYANDSDKVDDLPVIVDFQKKVQEKKEPGKKVQEKSVLHSMIKKINR